MADFVAHAGLRLRNGKNVGPLKSYENPRRCPRCGEIMKDNTTLVSINMGSYTLIQKVHKVCPR
jgi:hypothetical protein